MVGKSISSDITVDTVYEGPVSESPRSNPQTQNIRASAASSSNGSKEPSLKDLMTVAVNSIWAKFSEAVCYGS